MMQAETVRMAKLKRGARLDRGSFIEIEVDGLLWRITQKTNGTVYFEVFYENDFMLIEEPPAGIMRIWELVEGSAQGKGPH